MMDSKALVKGKISLTIGEVMVGGEAVSER